MAGVRFSAASPFVALVAATPKTVCRIIPGANHRVHVDVIVVAFDAAANAIDQPALVEVVRQTTDGTFSSLSPTKINTGDSESLEVTAQNNATVEPGTSTVLYSAYVSPLGGHVIPIPPDGPYVGNGGGTVLAIGVRVTATANVNCTATIQGEE